MSGKCVTTHSVVVQTADTAFIIGSELYPFFYSLLMNTEATKTTKAKQRTATKKTKKKQNQNKNKKERRRCYRIGQKLCPSHVTKEPRAKKIQINM